MDDQGAGGSSRGRGTYLDIRPMRESSLPPTLLPHLYHAPRHTNSPGFTSLIVPDWSNQPTRSRSQEHGRSLPSPSHLLRQTGPILDYDHVILSRSLDASPINPDSVTSLNLTLPRLVLDGPFPSVDRPIRSTRDHPADGYPYPSATGSTSTSGWELRPFSHPLPYGRDSTTRTPQPPQQQSRQAESSPGIPDVFTEVVGVLPQPEVPVRPPRDPYAELRYYPGFAREQSRGRSEVGEAHASRAQHSQVQTQGLRVAHEQGRVEGSQTDLFPSQSIRGAYLFLPLPPNVQCVLRGVGLRDLSSLGPVIYRPVPSLSQMRSR
jgi:hypothetical protein